MNIDFLTIKKQDAYPLNVNYTLIG